MSTTPPAAESADGTPSAPVPVVRIAKSSRTKRIVGLSIALVCLLGIGGYLKWRVGRDLENTQIARKELEAEGISVVETVAAPDEGGGSPFQSWGPGTVVRVQSNGGRISDAKLPKITTISQDLNLILSYGTITNDGLAVLEGRHNIRGLALNGTAVNDEGIKHLSGMNLQSLDLSSTKITDAGLAALGELDFPALNSLSLDHTGITNAGLMHLARFKNIEWLSIIGTKATKDGVRHLKAKLPQASVLD